MRLTNKLFAQHLGWTFKKHWQVQGKRVPRETGATAELLRHGILVKDPQEIVNTKPHRDLLDIVGYKPKEIADDETNPLWKSKVCHVYGDSNVLLEGTPQALLLCNTIEINEFPKNLDNLCMKMHFPKNVDKILQSLVMASHILDAEQVKLPKIKLAERPAYNLPRFYGISYEKKNRMLINKFIEEFDKLTGKSSSLSKRLCNDAKIKVTLARNQDLLQFNGIADIIITSKRPITPITHKYDLELPDLYPLKSTITIPKKNVYSTETLYPLSSDLNCSHPHTIVSFFNKEHVRNLHGTIVTNSQFQSRTMLKAVGVAVARAKQLYGDSALEKLPKPIVVQSIHTDGKSFHFGVFQLNTLLFGKADGIKNYWFHQPKLDLFDECIYKLGRPVLTGLNKEVFKYFYSFYNNS